MKVRQWSDEVWLVAHRLLTDTDWAFDPVIEETEAPDEREVAGFRILTGEGPVVLRTEAQVDEAIARYRSVV